MGLLANNNAEFIRCFQDLEYLGFHVLLTAHPSNHTASQSQSHFWPTLS